MYKAVVWVLWVRTPFSCSISCEGNCGAMQPFGRLRIGLPAITHHVGRGNDAEVAFPTLSHNVCAFAEVPLSQQPCSAY